MKAEFDWLSFVLRWTLSILLVLGTYNPFGFSYYDWVVQQGGFASFKVLVGVALLILHLSTIVSTGRALGPIGIALLVALYASLAWVLVDNRLLDLQDPRMVQLTMLLILAGLYGMGLSWAHIRNQLSGQVQSIDVTNFSPV
jgi:hypothetical protein